MQSMGRMKRSGSRFLVTPYNPTFKYSISNAEEEMENEDDVDWKKCKQDALTSRKGKSRQKEQINIQYFYTFIYCTIFAYGYRNS